jgi:hypothetical protein
VFEGRLEGFGIAIGGVNERFAILATIWEFGWANCW